MYQQQIWPSNAIDMPLVAITTCAHETAMSVYVPHIRSVQLTMSPLELVYIHFTLLTCALSK